MRVRRLVWPPTLQFLGAVIVLLVALAFALTYLLGSSWWHQSDAACKKSDLGCGLVIHLLGTGIVAAIAFYVFFLGRETYTAIWWRRRAKKTPEVLFSRLPPSGGVTGLAARKPMERRNRPLPTRRRSDTLKQLRVGSARSIADNVVSRQRIVKELAADLDAGASTQVLVGPTGSGKTMVLLKLVQYLAKRGQVPIAISLRDSSDLDFESQAWKAYRRTFPKYTEEEADKHWRWHRRGGLVVVVIDDLEEAGKEEEKVDPRAVMEALEATARNGLHVVAASRPSGVPAGFKQGRIDLEPLDEQEVRDALVERVTLSANDGHDPDHVIEVVGKIVEDAKIPSTPYYLAISRVLADTGRLTKLDFSKTDARLVLLDAYREDLQSGRSRADSGLDEDTRARTLEGLEAIALVSLGDPNTVEQVDEAIGKLLGVRLDTHLMVEYGQRLGVLESRYDDMVRFGHPTTLAYFASCYLVKNKHDAELWRRALDKAALGSAAGQAFVFANAAARDPELARSTSLQLLDRLRAAPTGNNGNDSNDSNDSNDDNDGAEDLSNPNERLLVLNTAEEIARRGDVWDGELPKLVIEHARKERDLGAVPREQFRLIDELVEVGSREAYDTLWAYATGAPDYSVRRRAMRRLLGRGGDAVKSALGHVAQVMQEVEEFRETHTLPVDNDRGAPFGDLRAVAWVLPSLRTVCRDSASSCRLDDYQRRLREHAEQMTTQWGTEASIADGLKQDAMRDPDQPVDEFALELLDPARRPAIFWFSRVLAVQAVARRCLARNDCESARKLVAGMRDDPHPFVRATARLCTRALRRGKWEPYIWVDMTQIASGANAPLLPEAKQLIGEIVLALNMNEHALDQLRTDFGAETRLPACLEFSPNRAEILGLAAPRNECPFLRDDKCLCPYTYHPPETGIRRELSRAFCREQRLNATRLQHSDIHVKALKDFWREMEDLARF